MNDISIKVRKTITWVKFKAYYEIWLNWVHQKLCKTMVDGEKDCISRKKIENHQSQIKDLAKKHCLLKEEGCKRYCLKYCDHFQDTSHFQPGNYFVPSCSDIVDEDGYYPSDKDLERSHYHSDKNPAVLLVLVLRRLW